MGKDAIVKVKNMDKCFGTTVALNNVSIEVRRGEIEHFKTRGIVNRKEMMRKKGFAMLCC